MRFSSLSCYFYFILSNYISRVIQLTPQQQSAEPRNSAGAEALAVARRPKEASREKTQPPPVSSYHGITSHYSFRALPPPPPPPPPPCSAALLEKDRMASPRAVCGSARRNSHPRNFFLCFSYYIIHTFERCEVFVGGVRLGVWGIVFVMCVCVGVRGIVLCRCVCVTC